MLSAWLRRRRAAVIFVAVSGVLLLLGRLARHHGLVAQGVRCNFVSLAAPRWPPACDDWTLERRIGAAEWRALAAFAGADVPDGAPGELAGTPGPAAAAANFREALLLTYATRGFVAMAAHWACRARDAGLRPHVVALDGRATCDALSEVVGWLPCLAVPPAHGVTSAFEPVHSKGYHDALTQRTRLTWMLVALGRDLVVSDSDVVFAPNATGLRVTDFVHPWADVTTMESSALGWTGHVVRAAVDWAGLTYPNFGFVHVRASVRTLTLFQLLHREQAERPLDDQYAYSLCVRAPWRGLGVAHFDRFLFQDGNYWHTQAHEPGARHRAEGADTRFAPHVAPVVVHLTSVPSARKLELLGYWGLWRAACGTDTPPLPYEVDAPRAGGPRLFAEMPT